MAPDYIGEVQFVELLDDKEILQSLQVSNMLLWRMNSVIAQKHQRKLKPIAWVLEGRSKINSFNGFHSAKDGVRRYSAASFQYRTRY